MKRECCHPRAKPGFWALIEILVVVAIIATSWLVPKTGFIPDANDFVIVARLEVSVFY